MWRRASSLALLVGLLALAACAAEERATPAPSPTGAIRPAAEQEWEKVLAAAKQEGKVAVTSWGGDQLRQALTQPFQKKYGITVNFIALTGGELAPRIGTERGAGQYLWDVYVHGGSSGITLMKPIAAFDPIEPALILPEVTEGKSWRGGALRFNDKDRQILTMLGYSQPGLMVNSNLAKAEDIKSYKDLLDPRWKGKLLLDDPRTTGSGQAILALFYHHRELGPDFIRSLAEQKPTMSRDWRQEVEWVAQGKYPILIGANYTLAAPLLKEGLPIQVVAPREGGYVTSGGGTVALYNKAPHPNAAKVYINWLLTKEGQTEFARAVALPSRRLDVPTEGMPSEMMPVEGYWAHDSEESVLSTRDKVVPFLREVFTD
ncbi:MAG TPA: extracellular solute-binding protein [Dehalococcoidia bacterium]|nr:extracellular solute-binding protein [Dehalococcoidia bacterium]